MKNGKKRKKKDSLFKETVSQYFLIKKKKLFLLAFVVTVGVAIGNIVPYLFGKIIDAIVVNNINLVLKLLIINFIINFFVLILNLVETYFAGATIQEISNTIKKDVFEKIIIMRCTDLDLFSQGELLNRLENDVTGVVSYYIDIYTSITQIVVNILVAVYFLLIISPQLSLISIVFIPSSYLINLLFKKKFRKIISEQKKFYDRYMSFVNEVFKNIVGIKAYLQEKKIISKISLLYDESNAILKKQLVVENFASGCKGIINNIFDLLLLYIASNYIVLGKLSVGNLVAFNQYLNRLFSAITSIMSLNLKYNNIVISLERIQLIKNKLSEEYEHMVEKETPSYHLEKIKTIQIEELNFAYADKNILNKLFLVIQNPGFYSVVGCNGSGKTTLIKLLMKFYECSNEKIFINQMDINKISVYELRSCIGYVSKDTFILNDSIKNNLLIANETITLSRMMDICKEVEIHDYVMSLQDQYETIVGENGIFLSSGQRQKLGLARALLKECSLLLLDEVTSDIDGNSEKSILKFLKKESQKKIIISISHKITTVKNSDRIILMEGGNIVETDSHENLYKKNELYQKLFFDWE